jgi:hypothetical protein
MAMAYDVLYAEFRDSVRELLRSIIARVVSGRRSWGMGLQDTRLASNWVLYNSNLWLANLAIEGNTLMHVRMHSYWVMTMRIVEHL